MSRLDSVSIVNQIPLLKAGYERELKILEASGESPSVAEVIKGLKWKLANLHLFEISSEALAEKGKGMNWKQIISAKILRKISFCQSGLLEKVGQN